MVIEVIVCNISEYCFVKVKFCNMLLMCCVGIDFYEGIVVIGIYYFL